MPGSDEQDLQVIAQILSEAGILAERVQESAEERCDFRGRDVGAGYLVEVKGLHDDDSLDQALRSGKDFAHARPMLDLGTVHSVARKAIGQMERTESSAARDHWIVAFVVRTRFGPGITGTQVLGSLYGVRNILGVREDGTELHARCLYFAESIFFRHKELDGAVLVDQDGDAALFANDHSPRHREFMACGLANWFGRHGGLNDATRMERAGGFIVADCRLDRKKPADVLAYMKTKLRLRTALELHLVEHSVTGGIERKS